MKATFKPRDYTSLSAYHVVSSADEYIDFLENLFGAERLRRYTDDKGRVVHAFFAYPSTCKSPINALATCFLR